MFIMDDGIRLNAKLDLPTPSEGKHPLVIVIHGFTGHMEERHITAVQQTLNDKNITVKVTNNGTTCASYPKVYGLFLDANDHALCPFLFLMWMATVPLFAILSPALRPDDAYKTKKPLIPNKFIHFLAQLVLGLLTFVSGAVMFAIAAARFM